MGKARKFICQPMTVEAQQFWPGSDTRPDGVTSDQTFGGEYIASGDWAVKLPNGEKVVIREKAFREIFCRVEE